MKELLTPRQVARAIQVSESSVKRWCDKGMIPTRYTAGGHRRIPLSGLLQFLKEKKYELVEPAALGLPATSGQSTRVIDRGQEALRDALIAGDEAACRQIGVDLFLAEHSVSTICDEVFARAFRDIGDLWECGDAEVYQERRACEVMLRVLHDFRSLVPAPANDAPLAMGAAAEGDPYSLATSMTELVLRDSGWNSVSLGDNLPFVTLSSAIERHRPRLFWLSCSHLADEQRFIDGYSGLYDAYGHDVAFVLGGRVLRQDLREKLNYSAYCDNMQHLVSFANTLKDAIRN